VRRAIVGLGNPGPRYVGTPHNVGFVVLDAVASRLGIALDRRDHGAIWGRGSREELGEIVLAKPQRYMNRSGGPARAVLEECGVAVPDVLVVHDDLDLDLARVKLKRGGGAGGHRGLESLLEELGDASFCRLRIGIGRPPAGDAADYVLGPFPSGQEALVADALGRSAEAALSWLSVGMDAAMNRVNAAAARPGSPEELPAPSARGPVER